MGQEENNQIDNQEVEHNQKALNLGPENYNPGGDYVSPLSQISGEEVLYSSPTNIDGGPNQIPIFKSPSLMESGERSESRLGNKKGAFCYSPRLDPIPEEQNSKLSDFEDIDADGSRPPGLDIGKKDEDSIVGDAQGK